MSCGPSLKPSIWINNWAPFSAPKPCLSFYQCVKYNTELTWVLCEGGTSGTLRVS